MKSNLFLYLLKKIFLVGYLIAFLAPNTSFACGPQSSEDFETFFKSFKTSKGFAVDRTLYPYTWATEAEGETTRTVITKEGDSKYPPLAISAKENELLFKTESIDREKAIVKMYASDTSWSFRFHFLNKKGCWFLGSVTEISM